MRCVHVAASGVAARLVVQSCRSRALRKLQFYFTNAFIRNFVFWHIGKPGRQVQTELWPEAAGILDSRGFAGCLKDEIDRFVSNMSAQDLKVIDAVKFFHRFEHNAGQANFSIFICATANSRG